LSTLSGTTSAEDSAEIARIGVFLQKNSEEGNAGLSEKPHAGEEIKGKGKVKSIRREKSKHPWRGSASVTTKSKPQGKKICLAGGERGCKRSTLLTDKETGGREAQGKKQKVETLDFSLRLGTSSGWKTRNPKLGLENKERGKKGSGEDA